MLLPATNQKLLYQLQVDLVAVPSSILPPESERATFSLNASFVGGREASFGAPPHSGQLCLHTFSGVPPVNDVHLVCPQHARMNGVAWAVIPDRMRLVSLT